MADSEEDPIIARLRADRDRHAALFGYDVVAIFGDTRRWQVDFGR